jgi:undecaprenyl-diphosphatase
MGALTALILGIVEGLTEYLPVSSTGHLVLIGHWMGQEGEAASSFEIVIQLGALLAVVAHYRTLLARHATGLLRGEAASRNLLLALFVAFLPVALVGLALRKIIKKLLFGPMPVAAALIAGGVVMIAWSFYRRRDGMPKGLEGLEHVTPKRALMVGLGQCFSLWPGTSRSMCTILSAEMTGLSTTTAAEFSFLVALPTLGAATAYETLKSWKVMTATIAPSEIAIGLVVSFFVAWAVIAAFLRYLTKYGLAPWGAYRIVVGVAVLIVLGRS